MVDVVEAIIPKQAAGVISVCRPAKSQRVEKQDRVRLFVAVEGQTYFAGRDRTLKRSLLLMEIVLVIVTVYTIENCILH